ncbi:MAG TPA: hypothetical protein VNZ26_34340 [Vicinamibacterales bacterium]|nr:hypothetical protein [Vicinamibacterales bacterium]
MPANVFVTARAKVTAGFANDVDEVNQNQRDECGAGRDRIGKQRDRHVAVREVFPHDARPDDCGEQ